jgi:hypothetical protein
MAQSCLIRSEPFSWCKEEAWGISTLISLSLLPGFPLAHRSWRARKLVGIYGGQPPDLLQGGGRMEGRMEM